LNGTNGAPGVDARGGVVTVATRTWRDKRSGTWSVLPGRSGMVKSLGSVAVGSVEGMAVRPRACGRPRREAQPRGGDREVLTVMCTTVPPGTAQAHARTTRCVGERIPVITPRGPAGLGVERSAPLVENPENW